MTRITADVVFVPWLFIVPCGRTERLHDPVEIMLIFLRDVPTGRELQFPLCGIFGFDADDRLAGERIYYDRATVLRQLGVFHEPDRMPGRLEAVLLHPITMARAMRRIVFRRRS